MKTIDSMPNDPTPAAVRVGNKIWNLIGATDRFTRAEFYTIADAELRPLVEALIRLAHLNPHDEQWCWCALDFEDGVALDGEPERHQDSCMKARAAYSRVTASV